MKLSILDLHGQHDLDLDLQKNAHFFLSSLVFFLIFVVFSYLRFFLEVAAFPLNTGRAGGSLCPYGICGPREGPHLGKKTCRSAIPLITEQKNADFSNFRVLKKPFYFFTFYGSKSGILGQKTVFGGVLEV